MKGGESFSPFCPQFLTLKLIQLSAWVDAVWEVEFTERKPLDKTIEEELTARQEKSFTALYQCLLAHADQYQSAGSDGSVWAVLGESGISVKSVVAVLSFFVLAGKSKVASGHQRVNSLCAASVYLLLLRTPGSISNKVFHEVLLDTCLDLTRHCWPQDSEKKRKKDLKSSQTEGKRSRPQRKDSPEMEMEEEDEEEEEVHLSGKELMRIRDAVALLVQSLLRLLQTFPLKDSPQTMIHCMQVPPGCICTPGSFHTVEPAGFHSESFSLSRSSVTCFTLNPPLANQLLLLNSENFLQLKMYNVTTKLHCYHSCLCCADTQMVEKNEYRSHGAQAVGMLTSQMASEDYACFIKWLCNFSRSSKMVHRLFSVDVVMVLLEQPERRPEECRDPDLGCFLMHSSLIQNLLFARRMDESPTVQGHALNCLAQCLELPSLNATRAIHNLFSASETPSHTGAHTFVTCLFSLMCFSWSGPWRSVNHIVSVFDAAKENLALLLRRVKDSKTNVRKAALQALLGLLKHDVIPMSWETLQTLSERCRDPAVSVKKKALQYLTLTSLCQVKPECSVVQKAWLQGVVPAVADSETSVQDKALEALDQVLLSQVKPYSAGCHLDASQRLMWELLGLLCHQCQKLSRYFSKAFTIWSKQKKFTPLFVSNLISHTEADHAAGAWLLLSKVVSSSSRLPHGKILDAWDKMVRSKDVNATTCCHILCVMGDIAVHLNEDTKERVQAVPNSCSKFESDMTDAHCECVLCFCQAFLNQRCGELVSACESYLASIILTDNGAQNLDEELMVKHLHTLGVASLQCPAKVNKRTVLLVESVLTTHSEKLCQTELPASLPLSQFKANWLPTRVRAHGVITLGKLALQSEELAQKYLPVFARELEVGTEVSVRSNVVVIMCDLCVRYTNMVDHYIPNISACLRDKDAVIREQTLIMLTNLLQEEFVKWKGSLFFDFMVALVDPVPAIVSLTEYCLLHLLLKKNPEMFSQHFIECIFHFNSYTKHKSYNKSSQSERLHRRKWCHR
uniref:Non-SMC condensin II complex subunit D3 n=1 Tax=Pundamilia nyererei TaxID=303518 RepID=A0A3B4F3T7_9CICH